MLLLSATAKCYWEFVSATAGFALRSSTETVTFTESCIDLVTVTTKGTVTDILSAL